MCSKPNQCPTSCTAVPSRLYPFTRTLGHGARQDVAAVTGVVGRQELNGRIAVSHVCGPGAEAEQDGAGRHVCRREVLKVDVQCVVGAFTQSALHAGVIRTVGPRGIDCVRCDDQTEVDVCRRVGRIELGKLVRANRD